MHIYPSLVRLCKAAGVRSVAIDLLSDNPYPPAIGFDALLNKEIGQIREKLWLILEGYHFTRDDVRSVRLDVGLGGLLLSQDPSRKVEATITSANGKVFASTAGDADV